MNNIIVPERPYPPLPANQFADARFESSRYGDGREANELSFGSILSMLWQHRILFCVCFAVVFAAAAVVILQLQPSYRSEAMLMVDERPPNITNLQSIRSAPLGTTDLNFVNSEMQILQSEQLARKVVTELHLQDNPEFVGKPSVWSRIFSASPLPGMIATVRSWLGIPAAPQRPKTPAELIEQAVGTYRQRFGAYNDGKSFVISTWFDASDPKLAQQILAEHLNIYLADQTAAKQELISKADAWFGHELARLSDSLKKAEARQQQFRDRNHLLRSGGETISGRQLADVTAQLAAARADLARKQARYDELNGLRGNASLGAAADPTVLNSPLIQKLREQEATSSQQVAQLQERYGSQHPQLVAARAALADVERKISREINRMTASAANDVAIARANTQQLENSVKTLEQQLGQTSEAELTASQLERKTDADRRLYEDLLLRSKQVAVQREMQEPDARIASSPSMPLMPAFPHRFLLFTISLGVAALLAGAITLIVDKLRTGPSQSLEEIEAECGLPGLAVLPQVKASRRRLRVALAPLSYLAASFQTLQNSVAFYSPERQTKVIAVASALPGDGKTTVAAFLARSLALAGKKVLLIDADLRRRGLTRLLRMSPQSGVLSQLGQTTPLKDAVATDTELGFDVLAVERLWGNPGRLLSRERVQRLFAEARNQYDAIVIDTPPLAAVDDALFVAALADATVMVVRWGSTPHQAIRAAVQRLRLAEAHVAGAVLNATDPKRHRSRARDLEAYRPLSGAYFLGRS